MYYMSYMPCIPYYMFVNCRKLRPIYSIKQAFSTSLWLAIFFMLVELSHNANLFTVTNVSQVSGCHTVCTVYIVHCAEYMDIIDITRVQCTLYSALC